MFVRQRVLLFMLEQADRQVGRLELTKWSFLLSHETPSRGGASFYEFLPYHFGPFSFCLHREAAKLVAAGLMEEPTEKTWRLTAPGRASAAGLRGRVKNDVERIVSRFGSQGVGRTVDYVYRRYPWFTVNSKRLRHGERPVAAPGVYTAGYEGVSVDGFLNTLMRSGIQRVIDVRRNPVARRYGFHRSSLDRLCRAVAIDYAHFPELGIPGELRRDLTSEGDYSRLFDRYEAETLAEHTGAVAAVAELALEKPSALVCMEADPARCHRSRLAYALSRRTGLPVRHVGGPTCEGTLISVTV